MANHRQLAATVGAAQPRRSSDTAGERAARVRLKVASIMSTSAVEQRAGSPEPPEPMVGEPARVRPRDRRLDPWLIAVVAAAISAGWAGRPSLWFDEGATISASANRTLPELWQLLGHIDAVHGLYYLRSEEHTSELQSPA